MKNWRISKSSNFLQNDDCTKICYVLLVFKDHQPARAAYQAAALPKVQLNSQITIELSLSELDQLTPYPDMCVAGYLHTVQVLISVLGAVLKISYSVGLQGAKLEIEAIAIIGDITDTWTRWWLTMTQYICVTMTTETVPSMLLHFA